MKDSSKFKNIRAATDKGLNSVIYYEKKSHWPFEKSCQQEDNKQ